MNKQLLDRHNVFAVRSKLGNIIDHTVFRAQFALLHENPGGGRGERLGRGHNDKSCFISRRFLCPALNGLAKGLHGTDFSVAGNRHLSGRQQAGFDFSLGPLKQGVDFFRVETDLFGIPGKKMCSWHTASPPGSLFAASSLEFPSTPCHFMGFRSR